jgi:hypothetical protein
MKFRIKKLPKKLPEKLSGKIFFASIFSAVVTLSSCATLTDDIVVSSHVNEDINIRNYKTFSWNTDSQISFDPIGQWEQPTLDTDEEVRSLIAKDLLKRGFRHTVEDPDLLVTFSAGINSDILNLSSSAANKNTTSTKVPKSALVVALTDAISGQTIWLAHADAGPQKQQSIDNIRKRIHYAIKQIFKTL